MRNLKTVRGLDGLRAVAVILVFLSHKAHVEAIDVGQLGVWLFFLISGYLIIGELHRARLAVEHGTSTRRYALSLFLAKRALRIYPVYYLLLAALAIAHATVYQRGVDLGLAWHAVFLSNFWIGVVKQGWPGSTSHFWSLAVEQQFYLAAPVVLLTTRASRHLACCAVAVALGAAGHLLLYDANASQVLIYAFSPWNFSLIALGGIGGIAANRAGGLAGLRIMRAPLAHWLPWLATAAVALLVTLPAWAPPLSGIDDGLADVGLGAALGALLLCVVALPDHPMVDGLEWTPLAYLGTISYGFYLFHNLIPSHFGVWPALDARLDLPPAVDDALPVVLQFAVAVGLAHLSWRYFERRLLGYREPVKRGLQRAFPATAVRGQ
ncbi:acyltransferase family protein [Burkholderia sp. 22PA0099]|uniref:acyltransferase family protein n=1 Tax=Burkholderia sp. 22PA0099 TaxID=3237372 RepID=UPI0039C13491